MNLQGCYTAIVTPFANGQVDFAALIDLVEFQIESGIDGIVPVGTTGESPTLDMDEHTRVIQTVIEAARGRCQIIAGTGANSTSEALELTRFARDAGADATLQVTPYYNKPSQEGLYRHFSTIADEIGLPVVLYNVPGRTATAIDIDTVVRLAANPHIVAIKEAGGSVDRVSQTIRACDITVLSGDDFLTYPMIALGARGIISVASNVIPAEVTQLAALCLRGEYDSARELHYRLYPFFEACFYETNPVPVKTALALMGKVREEFRLPMCDMTASGRERLATVMRAMHLLHD